MNGEEKTVREREWDELVNLVSQSKKLTRGSEARDRVAYLAAKWLIPVMTPYVEMVDLIGDAALQSKDHVDSVRRMFGIAIKIQEDLRTAKPLEVPE